MITNILTDSEIRLYVTKGEISQRTHDKLYGYFLASGEMPYGIAKARTGDPYQWIEDRLSVEFFR